MEEMREKEEKIPITIWSSLHTSAAVDSLSTLTLAVKVNPVAVTLARISSLEAPASQNNKKAAGSPR
jgi:hypothetical protein